MATEVYTNHASSERDDQSSVASFPRKTAGGPFSALGNRLQRALSGERAVRGEKDETEQERSLSRGRRGRDFKSSGRGGAGNIRSSSAVDEGSYVASLPVNGREVSESPACDYVSTGRGGSGNIRSPSRPADDSRSLSASRGRSEAEDNIIRDSNAAAQTHMHSAGRGGSGNIRHSVPDTVPEDSVPLRTTGNSRSPSSRMLGRGGAGNRL